MNGAEPKEVRDRATRWAEEGHSQLSILLRVLNDYDRLQELAESAERENERLRGISYENEQLRNRAESAERQCEQLREEVSRLQVETQRFRSEREEIANVLSKVVHEVISRLRANRAPSSHKILLIEDNAEVREAMAEILAALGHSVLQAADGREGLARLEAAEAVDLVLTDLNMPEMSGWDVVRAVKTRWPGLRVGIITGTPEALSEQSDSRVDFLITKPVTLDALREAISRLS